MAYFPRHRVLSLFLKETDFYFLRNDGKLLNSPLLESSPNIVAKHRFYHRTNEVRSKNYGKKFRSEAEEALLDYFYATRSFPFILAEYMSSNSPIFLRKLLEKVEIGVVNGEIGHSITRYLRYHPVNEFEPFFESSGLKPYEFVPILPLNLIYLADDCLLLQNYSVLCNYGIPRNKIGHIYMEATEIFSYDGGFLESKLQELEDMGLHRSSVCKFVTSSPIILINNGSVLNFMKEVKILGIKSKFIEAQLNRKSCHFTQIVGVLHFIWKLCGNQNDVSVLFLQHPGFFFEESGNKSFSLIGFLLKCGLSMQRIRSLFLQFPDIKVEDFTQNLRKCFDFFKFIKMKNEDIERIVQSHTVMLGSCSLKVPTYICDLLGLMRKQTCEIVKGDPEILMKWVLGSKIERLAPSEKKRLSSTAKAQNVAFFIELGFIKDSIEMEKAMKFCGCDVLELEERVDLLLKSGWDRKTVLHMLKQCPKLLWQTREVTEKKLSVLVVDFAIPLSSIMVWPVCLTYGMQRIKLRLTVYGWLKNQGVLKHDLSLSYILSVGDKIFLRRFVNRIPRGPYVWEEFKKQIFQ